jgi:cell division protease FtsH
MEDEFEERDNDLISSNDISKLVDGKNVEEISLKIIEAYNFVESAIKKDPIGREQIETSSQKIKEKYKEDTIKEKLKNLENARILLKDKFFGIDKQIDELIDGITSWYIVPEAQCRPVIFNLWGMTGCGKTTLIRELANMIRKPLVEISSSVYAGESGEDFSYSITKTAEKYDKVPAILMIDDLQLCRTKTETGHEKNDSRMGQLWSLLSDGKIAQLSDEYLSSLIGGLKVKLLSYKALKDQTKNYNGIFNFTNNSQRSIFQSLEKDYFLTEYKWTLYDYNVSQVLSAIKMQNKFDIIVDGLLNDYENTVLYLINELYKINAKNYIDFKYACIIICGNLDEVYPDAEVLDPDIEADTLHKLSLEIGVPNIKMALLDRFRPEQISRLGNNHIIFPAFKKDDFYKIIHNEVANILSFFNENFELKLICKDELYSTIYKEGVYPSQGVRPVLTTIGNIFHTQISKFISHIKIQELSFDIEYTVTIDENERCINFYDSDNLVVSYPIELKLKDVRRPRSDRESFIPAVHEAGHAFCGLLLGNPPLNIYSRTSSHTAHTEFANEGKAATREEYFNLIVLYCAGFVAEEVFFGKEFVTDGCNLDLRTATKLAAKYFSSNSFGKQLGYYVPRIFDGEGSDFALIRSEEMEKNIELFLKKALRKSRKIIKKNKDIVIELAKMIVAKGVVGTSDIMKFKKEYKIKSVDKLSNAIKKFKRNLEISKE